MGDHDMFGFDAERLAQHAKVKSAVYVRSTATARQQRAVYANVASDKLKPVEHKVGDFTVIAKPLTEPEAISESERCMKCADAPCTKGCPTSVDIKSFIHSISKMDYYHAAKVIYSDNPLGLTCGVLCSQSKQCQLCCNMRYQVGSAIDIGRLQQFACDVFHKMQVPQVLPNHQDKSYATKIALVGGGPASLACATFLARMGYSDLTIFERMTFHGGLPAFSIPEFRFGFEQYSSEWKLAQELGVKVVTGKKLGADFTLKSLAEEGYACIFLGVGRQKPFCPPFLEKKNATNLHTFYDFLLSVALATKTLTKEQRPLPKLSGHVLVLGGGDVAYDTAGTAFRCGAERVTLAFREDFANLPCSREEIDHGLWHDKVDLMANVLPTEVIRDATGAVTSVVLQHKDWTPRLGLSQPEGQKFTVKCDHVVVCFGAQGETDILSPLELLPSGHIKIDPTTNCTSMPNVFAGGDCVGSTSIVEAVNDAKTSAWFMHNYIQQQLFKNAVASVPRLPIMRTAIDNVDLSVDVCGIHFENPYGLSSATPTGCVDQIWRAFEMGWGFAVTKTIVATPVTNISPRIIRAPSHRRFGPNQDGFQNIELLTEKTLQYWIEGIQKLKKDFPKAIVIASVMAAADKESWEQLSAAVASAKPDALELNLSCPHVGKKGFGMLAGQSPELVQSITSWVRKAVDPKLPVFVKLTPNITNIVDIATAAKLGGADGVTAINTVGGLSNIQSSGIPYPSVGSSQKTAYGGVSGNMIRPMALKAVSAIHRALPDFPILGCGGIDSAESAMQMINCGASVIQITSAIQNQDYSIIDELNNGLQALLYMKSRPDLRDWKGQMPPLGFQPAEKVAPAPVPTIKSQIGVSVPYISVVPELDLNAQVKAQVDADRCLRCGKCYLSCNDTGYCAIKFNPDTHLPEITDDCMGCGLCQSVCPSDCITYTLKVAPHKPKRGIRSPSDPVLPFDDNQTAGSH